MTNRFERQERLFGKEGQAKLSAAHAAVVGVGGLGTHVAEQLAFLGVGRISLIDPEELSTTNRNRYVGTRHTDPIPGSKKVLLSARLINEIDPSIHVATVAESFVSTAGFQAITSANYAFGCLDSEGGRLVLNELCLAYTVTLIDLASDVVPGDPIEYGGRVCTVLGDNGCLMCRGLIDLAEAQGDLANDGERKARERIYGVDQANLANSGPSVVSINAVVASLGVTEFLVASTGLRLPAPLLYYRGTRGIVTRSTDIPYANCFFCQGIRGQGLAAHVERYLRPVQ